MAPTIIQSYRKDLKFPPGHGYGRFVNEHWIAVRSAPMSSEVVHSTSNGKPTSIEHEATFLRDSPDVSCGDLIAKNGDVYIILPDTMIAWHAGKCIAAFDNFKSFGTELHVSLGEQPTQAQIDSLAYRIQQRRLAYGVVKEHIDTHRAIALPKGRKQDPTGWSDVEFYRWRDGLFLPTPAEVDFATLWGTRQPYFMGSGVAQAWRDAYRQGTNLGAAVSDELSIDDGVVRIFEHGYITYSAKDGVKVRTWK